MQKREIYTTIDLAKILDVSERTILDAIRNKEIKATKKFNKWYVTHQNLMFFLESEDEEKPS